MDEKKKSVSSNAVMYGALVAGVGIVYSLILYILDLSMNKWLGNVSFLFYIGGMIWGTLQYRKNSLGDYMSYSQAVSCAFQIGFYTAIMLAVYTFIFFNFIDPGMIDKILATTREQIVAKNPQLSEDQVDKAVAISRYFTNSYVLPIMSLFMSAIFSIILALIIAIFIKKEDASLQKTI